MSLLANQRARSATEIIDASVQFYRAHAMPLLTIAAIVTIPPAVITVLVPDGLPQALVSIAGNLLFSVGGAAASLYATKVITDGEVTVGQAFRGVSGRVGNVIVAQILFGFAVIVGLVFLVIPGLIFATRYSLGTTIAAVEGLSGNKALERSWALTKGHARHAFNTLGLSILIAIVILMGGSFLAGLLGGVLKLDESQTGLFVELIMMVISPFIWVVVTLLYIDVRVRVEGADIAAMVAELPRPPIGTPIA